MVAFFVWIVALFQILTLDNLMRRGLLVVNQCYMCRFKGELMEHLLLHCDVAHALWVNMFRIFEVQWVMLGSVDPRLCCEFTILLEILAWEV